MNHPAPSEDVTCNLSGLSHFYLCLHTPNLSSLSGIQYIMDVHLLSYCVIFFMCYYVIKRVREFRCVVVVIIPL